MNFLAGEPSVRFRFTFSSGSTCNSYDGIAMDAFTISEVPVPQPFISFTCQPGNTITVSATSSWCPQQWSWDFGDTSQSADTSDDQNTQFTYNAPGNYIVSLIARHECSASGTVTANVNFPGITLDITPVNCADDTNGSIEALVTGVNNPVITWNTDPPFQGNALMNQPAGIISVNISSDDGCAVDTLVEIPYGPDAFPVADLGPDRYICTGENLILSPGTFSNYQWQDLSTDSAYLVFIPGTYHVEVENASGCIAADTIEVIYSCPDAVWIPSAFTPGLDGLNDLFYPQSSVFETARLTVFNRWGQPVFESNAAQPGWDGTLNGEPCPEGIYFYRFRYRIPGDKAREKAGLVTLLR
jgi:gliding motility-associated-like protein